MDMNIRGLVVSAWLMPLIAIGQTPPSLGTTATPEISGAYYTNAIALSTSAKVYFGAGRNETVPAGQGNMFSTAYWAYDPVANSWSSIPSGPGTDSPLGFVVNDKVYVGGGGGFTSGQLYVYDPVANTWTLSGSLNGALGQGSRKGFSIGSKGYCIASLTATELYDYEPVVSGESRGTGM